MARCLDGDADAWEAIVRFFAGRIFSMSYHYTGRTDEAEDLTQDILIRIYQNLASYREESGRFAAWALSLSRNLIIDRLRHTRWLRRCDGSEQLETLHIQDHATPGPQRRIEQAEASSILGEALRALSPETKEAIILKDLHGMGYREMAAMLGVPEGTIKSRLNRGRAALAHILARHRGWREMQGRPALVS